jgi:hypothetical protein
MVKYTQLPKASRGYTWTEDEKTIQATEPCKNRPKKRKGNTREIPRLRFVHIDVGDYVLETLTV